MEVPGSKEALLGGEGKAKKQRSKKGRWLAFCSIFDLECWDLAIARDGD